MLLITFIRQRSLLCSLPSLRRHMNSLLKSCSEELKRLPPPSTNPPSSELLLRISKFCGGFHNVVDAVDDKTMVRKARERYEQYKWDILETAPDFRPFITYGGYVIPGPPRNEDSVGSLGGPMDLMYVRKVIKECVHFVFRKDMLNLHHDIDPLDGNSWDTFHLMPQRDWFWTLLVNGASHRCDVLRTFML